MRGVVFSVHFQEQEYPQERPTLQAACPSLSMTLLKMSDTAKYEKGAQQVLKNSTISGR